MAPLTIRRLRQRGCEGWTGFVLPFFRKAEDRSAPTSSRVGGPLHVSNPVRSRSRRDGRRSIEAGIPPNPTSTAPAEGVATTDDDTTAALELGAGLCGPARGRQELTVGPTPRHPHPVRNGRASGSNTTAYGPKCPGAGEIGRLRGGHGSPQLLQLSGCPADLLSEFAFRGPDMPGSARIPRPFQHLPGVALPQKITVNDWR